MEQKQNDILLIMSIMLGLVSVPLVWVSVPTGMGKGDTSLLSEGLTNHFSVLGNGGVNLTGWSGSFPFLQGIPFWLVSLLVVFVSLILLLSSRNIVQISSTAELGMALFPAVLVSIGYVVLLITISASPRIGILLAVVSTLLPIYYLWKKYPL